MVRSGTVLLVLSDRNIAKDRLPVPAPMAVGAIQTRLVDQSLRCDANIIVETASARDPHPLRRSCWASARRLFIHTLPMKRWAAR